MTPVTYAVGDLHGRFDLLEEALSAIDRHAEGASARLVFLGDYVDRGPQSREVVERLKDLTRQPSVVCLKGNHEALMIQGLASGGRKDFDRWLNAGGVETLESYGAAADYDEARATVPPEHLRWMQALPLTSGDGARIYVHAGLMPSMPLDQQREEHCLWIRERFLQARADAFEAHIVHGHTPTWTGKVDPAAVELLAHRTNLDSGAYLTGVLTVGVFPHDAPSGPFELLRVTERGTEVLDVSPSARQGGGWLGGLGLGRRPAAGRA